MIPFGQGWGKAQMKWPKHPFKVAGIVLLLAVESLVVIDFLFRIFKDFQTHNWNALLMHAAIIGFGLAAASYLQYRAASI